MKFIAGNLMFIRSQALVMHLSYKAGVSIRSLYCLYMVSGPYLKKLARGFMYLGKVARL